MSNIPAKRGSIKYTLWTVTGNIELTVKYTIRIISDENIGVEDLEIIGEGLPPQLEQEDIDDIIHACVKNSDKKDTSDNGMKGFDFSLN